MDGRRRSVRSPGQGDFPLTCALGISATLVQYRSVVVCERSDLVMLDGFSADQQASRGSTLRLECGLRCINGTLGHAFYESCAWML